MRSFIIGATGYIGSHVAMRLLRNGAAVTGLARAEQAAATLEGAGLSAVLGDATQPDSLEAAMKAADAVIFAPQLTQEAEQASVLALLDGLAGSGKTFVFVSGTGVMGQRTAGFWSEDSFAEHDAFVPLKQLTTRVATEQAVLAAAARNIRTMVVRPPAIVGYGHNWHEQIVRQSVATTGAACYVGPGLSITTTVHIDDLCDLVALLLDRGVAGGVYHASACEYNGRAMAETVAALLGCRIRSLSMDEAVETLGRFETLMVLGVSSRSRSPASRALGWSPRHPDLLEDVRRRGPAPALAGGKAFG